MFTLAEFLNCSERLSYVTIKSLIAREYSWLHACGRADICALGRPAIHDKLDGDLNKLSYEKLLKKMYTLVPIGHSI